MQKILLFFITIFTSILFFCSLALSFQIIQNNSHNFPGMASDGSGAFTQIEYRVLCDDGHEISCLQQSYQRIGGIAVGCAADYTQQHKLYVTDRKLLNFQPGSLYQPSATVEKIGRFRCINPFHLLP